MALKKPIPPAQGFRITRHIILFFSVWSIVVLVLVAVNGYRLQKMTREIAIREARSSFKKDQAIRYWATLHGGVYVPVDANTPPNPYLSHIPNRDILSPTGKKLTLMNPAYMIRQMNDFFSEQYNIDGHITSLNPLRPDNRADSWETTALASFEHGNQESLEFTEINGKPFLRLMQPMTAEQGCLKCHGHQGYKVGDIRGGVAISWPMEDLLLSGQNALISQSVSLFVLWLLGSCCILFEGKRLRTADMQRDLALAKVEEINERLEFVVEGARVGTWDWNVETDELLLNERWAEMLGYALAEIRPHASSWKKLLHPDDANKTIQAVSDLLKDHTPSYMSEHRLRHKSGKWVWVLAVGKVLERGPDGKALRAVGIHLDISNQKEQEERRLKTSLREEQFKHFESLKTMAGAIAHRFNNAMMGVLGNLDLLSFSLPDESKEYKLASEAAKAARGASRVGSMMLSYVGQRPLKLEEKFLSNLVNEALPALNTISSPAISLNVIPPVQEHSCSLDSQQIQEVMENILINAVESLESESGTIEISFGTEYCTADSFPIPFQTDDTKDTIYTFCQIKDTGKGISQENLRRIFEPFYTTQFVGRGLGLALAVGVMRLHHGAITVLSTQDKGTTIRVLLPAISSSQKETPPAEKESTDHVQLSGDILLVDDDPIILSMGTLLLERMGFIVHTAVNGQKAVDKVRKQDIDFRAAVMDISMPVMDGIEAMKRMREITPGLPILFCSGYSENDFTLLKSQGTRPDCFLRKPVELEALRKNLEKLLS